MRLPFVETTEAPSRHLLAGGRLRGVSTYLGTSTPCESKPIAPADLIVSTTKDVFRRFSLPVPDATLRSC